MENFTHDMMDELLVKYLAEEATPPEQEMVESWIEASEANRDYFRQFQLIWEKSKQVVMDVTLDEGKAWQRFQRRVKREELLKKQPPGFRWWHIAASVLVVAGAAWLTSTLLVKATLDPEIMTLATANEVKIDTLPDGSVATLNKHSVISYPYYFKEKTRTVQLQGEAFFSVKSNRQKPFIIEINDVVIKVLGTSFNIKSSGDSTEVIVETGVVEVTRDDRTIILQAGERAILSGSGSTPTKQVTDDKLYNYYVSKTFVCDNTPLWKLVEKLNEAYDANIKIGKDSLRKLPLTVTFDDESLETILDIIAQTLLVKVSKADGEITLY